MTGVNEVSLESSKTKIMDIFAKYVLLFAQFALVGWIYEVALGFIYGFGFVNRGFLFGPFLPVYGFAGIILYLAFNKLMSKKIRIGKINITPVLIFLGIIIIATTVELVAGLLLEYLKVDPLWDYTRFKINYKGIIAMNPSIRFGIAGIAMFYLIMPLFGLVLNKLSAKTKRITAVILFVYLVIDFICTLILR